MTRRRTTIVAALAALSAAGFGVTSAHADTVPSARMGASHDYVACVAVDAVDVGACVGNPIPDVSHLPSPGPIVDDLLP